MSPRFLEFVFLLLTAPFTALANPIAPPSRPKAPAVPGLARKDVTVRFVKDPELGARRYFAVVRIPREQLQKLLAESDGGRSFGLMTIIAGVSLSAAAVAAGLIVRSRLRPAPLKAAFLVALCANGIAFSAFALQPKKPTKEAFPADALVQVPCVDYPFLAVIETFDADPGDDGIAIHLPANLTIPPAEDY